MKDGYTDFTIVWTNSAGPSIDWCNRCGVKFRYSTLEVKNSDEAYLHDASPEFCPNCGNKWEGI